MILKCSKCGSLSQDFQGASGGTKYTCRECVPNGSAIRYQIPRGYYVDDEGDLCFKGPARPIMEKLVSLPVKWKEPEKSRWGGPKTGEWEGTKASYRKELESEADQILRAAKEREASGDALLPDEDHLAYTAEIISQWREDFAKQRRDDSRGLAIELLRIFGDESSLSSQERDVWRMFSIEGKSVRDVQEATGVSKSNVAAVAGRAQVKLARSLKRAKKSAGLTSDQRRVLDEMSHFCGQDELYHDDAGIEDTRRDSLTEHLYINHDE